MTQTQICVTLRGHTIEDMIRDANRATAAGANLVEVRFDNLYVNRIEVEPIVSTNADGDEIVEKQPPIMEKRDISDIDVASSISELKAAIKPPVVFVCRSENHGGYFHGSESERIQILDAAIESSVSWIDIEIDMDSKARKKLMKSCGDDISVVASSHLPRPSSSEEIIEYVNSNSDSGTIIKCCYTDVDHASSLHVFEAAYALGESELDVTLMGIGRGGDWPRLHAPLLKQALVYTTLERDYSLFQRGMVNINDLRTAWSLLEYE
ncbi:MAG: type I 3-dehydroquinate dehydratase [Candidatus Thermoplasmatota archaeon]|nr:type I 3-dehydroquinate dehydratase [Candidatus Thermoplasmatota archaeon]MEE3083573.1 type I 3-dehydroquinate dehydratase [Candidatus Thermoplasmatota archaeon]